MLAGDSLKLCQTQSLQETDCLSFQFPKACPILSLWTSLALLEQALCVPKSPYSSD